MRVAVSRRGPAGLYFAIAMKLHDPRHDVVVVERNRPYDTFGWGVVLSDETLANLEAADADSAEAIRREFVYWDDIAVHYRGSLRARLGTVSAALAASGSSTFCRRGRKHSGSSCASKPKWTSLEPYRGLRPHYRQRRRQLQGAQARWRMPSGRRSTNGETNTFGSARTRNSTMPSRSSSRRQSTAGSGCMRTNSTSTLRLSSSSVRSRTWRRAGFDRMSQEETVAACERIFARYLGGHTLMTNARHLRGSAWLNFNRVLCERWSHGNVVLLGDAAATAHFSVGSGTKLALESAIALAHYLHSETDMQAAFRRYEEERRTEVLRLQSAARNSTEWFEEVERYLHLRPRAVELFFAHPLPAHQS